MPNSTVADNLLNWESAKLVFTPESENLREAFRSFSYFYGLEAVS